MPFWMLTGSCIYHTSESQTAILEQTFQRFQLGFESLKI